MAPRSLENELRLLRACALTSCLAVVGISTIAFRSQRRQRFDEIDVQRINVVEPNGRLRLVITNTPRSPGLIDKGVAFGDTAMVGKRGGIIFYNDDGTESGGVAVRGHRRPDGVSAHGGLSFDRFEQEDVVMLDYDEDRGAYSEGLKVADRSNVPLREILKTLGPIQRMPDGEEKARLLRTWGATYGPHAGGVVRVFVGRDTAASALLDLRDRAGKTRLRLAVDASGAPRIEFLDAAGAIKRTITADEMR